MKLYNIKPAFLTVTVLSIAMTSCLKDKAYDDGDIQSVHGGGSIKPIEIKLTAGNSSNFALTPSLPYLTKDTTLDLIPVNLATSAPSSEDINVTLEQDNSLVEAYNSDATNLTKYAIPPSTMFSILNNAVVTIPKGSNTGYLQVTLKTANFADTTWALGYKIKTVDKSGYTISGNLNSGIIAFAVTNKYEGLYQVTGHFAHPTVPRDINMEDYLSTASFKSVSKTLGDLTGTKIIVTIDARTNQVTVSPGANTSGTTASVKDMPGDPKYNNTYDPATHTFWLKYGYPQPGPTRIITEKVTLE